jgi:hypothetical protein
MAGFAIPLIEAAAVRVLARIGVGAVAGGAAHELSKTAPSPETVRERQEAADRAMASPVACTDVQTGGSKQKCLLCPPDKGAPFNRSTAGWSEASIEYQVRIGGMPVGPGFITEWMFSGVTFDGFDSSQCLLKEAKAKYDQFFDDFGYRKDFWTGHVALLEQAIAQSAVAAPRPPVQLKWYFMESKSYRFFSKMFTAAELPIETVFQP